MTVPALKGAALVLCGYEIAAITSGRMPTVSRLSHRHWWFEAALLVAFAVDVHYLQRQIRLAEQHYLCGEGV